MAGGRHNLATAPLRKISSLPPSPPFFLARCLLFWPEHGRRPFFFSEEDKTGYNFKRGIGLKKKKGKTKGEGK